MYYDIQGNPVTIRQLSEDEITKLAKGLKDFGLQLETAVLTNIIAHLSQELAENTSEYGEAKTGEFEATKTAEWLADQYDTPNIAPYMSDEDWDEIVYRVAYMIGWW